MKVVESISLLAQNIFIIILNIDIMYLQERVVIR